MIELLTFIATFGINRLVEPISDILKKTTLSDESRRIILRIVSLVAGVVVAFTFNTETLFVGTPAEVLDPVVLKLFTGLALAGGANGWNFVLNYIGTIPPVNPLSLFVRSTTGSPTAPPTTTSRAVG